MKCNVVDNQCEYKSKRSVPTISNYSTNYFVLYNKQYFCKIDFFSIFDDNYIYFPDINIPNEIKNLESSKNKLQKSATSNKSPKPLKNNVENNCQCKSQSKSKCKSKRRSRTFYI